MEEAKENQGRESQENNKEIEMVADLLDSEEKNETKALEVVALGQSESQKKRVNHPNYVTPAQTSNKEEKTGRSAGRDG